MYTIYFKNGLTKNVSKSIAYILNEKITEGCSNFQTFSDQNGKLISVINVSEIVFIEENNK